MKLKRIIKSLLWLVFYFFRLKTVLMDKLNVKNIKVDRFLEWNLGRAYFSGYNNNKKVFIKVYSDLMLLENEFIFYNLFKNKLDLIKVINYFSNEKIQVIIYEFIESRQISEVDIINNPEILLKIYKIILIINKHGFIHRDIRKENILITNQGVRLIDFSFIVPFNRDDKTFIRVSPGYKNSRILKYLGDGSIK